jgi:hypothetical protein
MKNLADLKKLGVSKKIGGLEKLGGVETLSNANARRFRLLILFPKDIGAF